jgi:hypothetical protein
MVIQPGITTSWTRTPPEEWLFHQESLDQERGMQLRNGIPPEITTHKQEIHPKNGISLGIKQLMEGDSDR